MTQVKSNEFFIEETHQYFKDGVEYPSASRLMEEEGIRPPFFGSPRYAIRGKYVHLMTKLDDEGLLEEGTIDPLLIGYREAWHRFRHEWGFIPTAIEEPVFYDSAGPPELRYATTPDRLGYDKHSQRTLVEIKTGALHRWHRIQTALQQLALPDNYLRVAVKLNEDGTYTRQEHNDKEDIAIAYVIVVRYSCSRMLLEWQARFKQK